MVCILLLASHSGGMKQPQNSHVLAGMAVMAMILIAGCTGNRIAPNGLSFARLGAEMPNAQRLDQKASDTLFSENGFEWRAVKMAQGDGQIWVEESFDQSGHIGRIRIESADFSLKKGIRVGQSAAEILPKGKQWHLRAYPDYSLVEASCAQFPHTYFLFTAPSLDFSEVPSDLSIEHLGHRSRLEKIVVM